MSSRTDLYDDVVDVTSFLALLDVVGRKGTSLSASLSALDAVEIKQPKACEQTPHPQRRPV